MNRSQLIDLVAAIQEGSLSEAEVEDAVRHFEAEIQHPAGNGLIFWPNEWGLPMSAGPEAIVTTALSWQPRVLALRVKSWSGLNPASAERLLLLEGGEYNAVSAVSEDHYDPGKVIAVALSGVTLLDGRTARHHYVKGAYTMGIVLEGVTVDPGTDLTARYSRPR